MAFQIKTPKGLCQEVQRGWTSSPSGWFWSLSEPGASLETEEGHGEFVYAPNPCKLFMPQKHWRASGATPVQAGPWVNSTPQDLHKSSCFAQGQEEKGQNNPFTCKCVWIPDQMWRSGWHRISLHHLIGVLKKADLEIPCFGTILCNCSFLIFNCFFYPKHCSFPDCLECRKRSKKTLKRQFPDPRFTNWNLKEKIRKLRKFGNLKTGKFIGIWIGKLREAFQTSHRVWKGFSDPLLVPSAQSLQPLQPKLGAHKDLQNNLNKHFVLSHFRSWEVTRQSDFRGWGERDMEMTLVANED